MSGSTSLRKAPNHEAASAAIGSHGLKPPPDGVPDLSHQFPELFSVLTGCIRFIRRSRYEPPDPVVENKQHFETWFPRSCLTTRHI
jgi:hypothetical protein